MEKRLDPEKGKDKLNYKSITNDSPFSSKKNKENNSNVFYIYPPKGDQDILIDPTLLSSQSVQEMIKPYINPPKEYGKNLLKRISILFI